MTKLLARFAKNESGATAIEYGLIAALIAVALILLPVVLIATEVVGSGPGWVTGQGSLLTMWAAYAVSMWWAPLPVARARGPLRPRPRLRAARPPTVAAAPECVRWARRGLRRHQRGARWPGGAHDVARGAGRCSRRRRRLRHADGVGAQRGSAWSRRRGRCKLTRLPGEGPNGP